jgi:hypothetical protein
LPGWGRPWAVRLGLGVDVVLGHAPARRMHVGAAAVGRVHAALRVEGLERGAQRRDVVLVYAAAIRRVHHLLRAVGGGGGMGTGANKAGVGMLWRYGLTVWGALQAHGSTLVTRESGQEPCSVAGA